MNAPEPSDESAPRSHKPDDAPAQGWLGGFRLSSPSRLWLLTLLWTALVELALYFLLLPSGPLTWSDALLHSAVLVTALAPGYYLSFYMPLRSSIAADRHARQALQEALDQVQKIVDSAFDGIVVIDEQARIESFNPAAERIFGQTAASVLGKNISSLMPEPYRSQHDAYVARYVSAGQTKIIGAGRELQGLRNGVEVFPIELHVTEYDSRSGRHFVGTIRDISRRKNDEKALKLANEKLEERVAARTSELEAANEALNREIAERKRIEARLHEIATTDALTGVLNRREFDRLMSNEYEKLKRYPMPSLSIVLFDVDRFKQVNDRYGHLVGDKVLIELASLVKTKLRRSDIFARWGGEEFVILAHGNREQVYLLAEKLRTSIAEHAFPDLGHITCSFGVAEFSVKETMIDTIETADRRLYAAKAGGRNRVEMAGDALAQA